MLAPLLSVLLIILAPAAHAATDLSVMSFNIRYGTADDGENHWNHRRDMVAEVFRTRHADIVGVQEALNFQITEITTANPTYAVLGVGRDDGLAKGEFSAILYRADRFAVAESGTFWLSDTPDTVASATWGNRITRVCTWARLIDRASGDAFYIFNTHFDHESQPSRERSARLIAERIAARASPDPVILMGDFNAGETNPAITFFTQSPQGPALLDTYRAIHPDETTTGTFNAFRGNTDGERIDAILVTPGITIHDADIDRTSTDGRFPSDHFPVWAKLTLPRPAD